MQKIIITLVLLFSSHTLAGTSSVTGKVTQVQLMSKIHANYTTQGEAIAFIYMNELPIACENSGEFRRVAITSNHPAFNVVVSSALAAKIASQTISMHYITQCTQFNNNAWDFSILKVL